MPDSYFELRHAQTVALEAALDVFELVAAEFEDVSGRPYAAVEPYRLDDAERAIVLLGSTGGTVKDVVDELREDGDRVGLLEIRSFRPFPEDAVRRTLWNVPFVAVLDRADSPGAAAPLYADVAAALYGSGVPVLRSYVYGLGGREVHPSDIRSIFRDVDGLETRKRYVGLEIPA